MLQIHTAPNLPSNFPLDPIQSAGATLLQHLQVSTLGGALDGKPLHQLRIHIDSDQPSHVPPRVLRLAVNAVPVDSAPKYLFAHYVRGHDPFDGPQIARICAAHLKRWVQLQVRAAAWLQIFLQLRDQFETTLTPGIRHWHNSVEVGFFDVEPTMPQVCHSITVAAESSTRPHTHWTTSYTCRDEEIPFFPSGNLVEPFCPDQLVANAMRYRAERMAPMYQC